MTIYALYLKLGRACYVTIRDFSDQPLVLKAFESYSEEYGPLEFYMSNSNRLSIDSALKDDKIEKSMYISTASGKCKLKNPAKRWSPLTEASRNSCTVIAHPVRGFYKGKSFGSEAKYLIELVREEGENCFLVVHSYDYKIVQFKDFQLTQDSLQSTEKLQQFLDNLLEDGAIDAKSAVAHSLDIWRKENLNFYHPYGRIDVPTPNWFEFFVVDRFRTLRAIRRTARSIRKQTQEIKKQKLQQTSISTLKSEEIEPD